MSMQLIYRMAYRVGSDNQRREIAGEPFLTEDEALEAWLRATGAHLAVSPEALATYREGYGAGADEVQRAQPLDPVKQRQALEFLSRHGL